MTFSTKNIAYDLTQELPKDSMWKICGKLKNLWRQSLVPSLPSIKKIGISGQ